MKHGYIIEQLEKGKRDLYCSMHIGVL